MKENYGSYDESHQRIKALFKQFKYAYMHLFTKIFSSTDDWNGAIDRWSKGLKIFSDDEIASALELCLKEKKFPPTLPEFIELAALKKSRNDVINKHKSDVVLKINYDRRCNQERASIWIKKVKETLNNEKSQAQV